MSLRSFHIFFIITSLGLLAFVAFWSAGRIFHNGESWDRLLAAASAGGFLLGIAYLGWFLKKSKKLQ